MRDAPTAVLIPISSDASCSGGEWSGEADMGQRESVCVCGKLNLNASASHCHNKLGISFMFHAPRYLLPHGHPTPFALHNNPPPEPRTAIARSPLPMSCLLPVVAPPPLKSSSTSKHIEPFTLIVQGRPTCRCLGNAPQRASCVKTLIQARVTPHPLTPHLHTPPTTRPREE